MKATNQWNRMKWKRKEKYRRRIKIDSRNWNRRCFWNASMIIIVILSDESWISIYNITTLHIFSHFMIQLRTAENTPELFLVLFLTLALPAYAANNLRRFLASHKRFRWDWILNSLGKACDASSHPHTCNTLCSRFCPDDKIYDCLLRHKSLRLLQQSISQFLLFILRYNVTYFAIFKTVKLDLHSLELLCF